MKLSELFSGRDDFASKTAIAEFIRNSKNFDSQREDPAQAETLLIFSTSKQHTWLVATSQRLYCILDDIRKDSPHINWSMSRDKLLAGGKIAIRIKARPHTANAGLVDIGDTHKDWLYTTRLFSDVPITERIVQLIERKMGVEK